jgi:hypothetical protein
MLWVGLPNESCKQPSSYRMLWCCSVPFGSCASGLRDPCFCCWLYKCSPATSYVLCDGEHWHGFVWTLICKHVSARPARGGTQISFITTECCGAAVFHAGPSTGMNWITNLEGAGTITPAGTRGATAMNGNFVMYQAGQILCVGGSSSWALVRFRICSKLLSARWEWHARVLCCACGICPVFLPCL